MNKDTHAIIKIRGTKSENAVRVLPCKNAIVHLLRWRNEFQYKDRRQDDYVFPSDKNRSKTLNKEFLSHFYQNLCRKAKIRKITPYSLRHRRITLIWEKTKDLRLTSKFGGHSIEVCENVYQHSGDNDIQNLILKEVYDIEEISETDKNKYDIRIETLEKEMREIREELLKSARGEHPIIEKDKKEIEEAKTMKF